MAHNFKIAAVLANAAVDDGTNKGIGPLFNSGFIDIYDGTQPADPSVAISTQTLLATLTFGATAFGTGSAGVITANAIGSGTGLAASTATWFRTYKSDHTTALADGSVGTATADIVLTTTSIVIGATVSLSSWTITEPNP